MSETATFQACREGYEAEFIPLAPLAQAELIKRYHAGLAATTMRTSAKKKRLLADGEAALSELYEATRRLLAVIVREQAVKRWGHLGAESQIDDLLGEATVTLIGAARSFDPDGEDGEPGEFPAYLAASVRREVKAAIDAGAPVKLPTSASRLARRARGVEQDLTHSLGRAPTINELRERLEADNYEWARAKLTDAERAGNIDLAIAKRLSKSGATAALANLEALMAAGEAASPLETADGYSIVDRNQGDASGADDTRLWRVLDGLDQHQRELYVARWGLDDSDEQGIRGVAQEYNTTVGVLRSIEASVRHRANCPHAHYALWANRLSLQFEMAPVDVVLPSQWLAETGKSLEVAR